MAFPTVPTIDYSYTAFQQAQGNNEFPGTQLDNDLANLVDGLEEVRTFLEQSFRADGGILPGVLPTTGDLTAYGNDLADIYELTVAAKDEAVAAAESAVSATEGKADVATTLAGYGIVDAAPLSHVGSGGAAHALATTSAHGFLASTDKSKLDGVASGATANSSDATLLDRTNHTGSQSISTVTGLQTALDLKAPATHVGSGGAVEHALATAVAAGFLDPDDYVAVRDYKDSFLPVKKFATGTIGSGQDATAAFQAAADEAASNGRGIIWAGTGAYPISQFTISSSNTILMGVGQGNTRIQPQSTTLDAIVFGDSVTKLQNCGMTGCTVYGGMSDPTSGALVKVHWADYFSMWNNSLANGFRALELESVIHSNFWGNFLVGGTNFTSLKTNSALLWVDAKDDATMPSELHFWGNDFRGVGGGLTYLDACVHVKRLDGLNLTGGHIGFALTGVKLAPAHDAATLVGFISTDTYFDTCVNYGLWAVEPSSSYAGNFSGHYIGASRSYNCGVAINWSCGGSGTGPSIIRAGHLRESKSQGINIYKGSHIQIIDPYIYGCNSNNNSSPGIDIGSGGASYVEVINPTVRQGPSAYAPYAGVFARNSASNVTIRGGNFDGCATDILLGSSATNVRTLGQYTTSKTVTYVASAATVTLPTTDVFMLSGTTGVTAIAGQMWDGRLVTFVTPNGAVTFTAGSTIGNTFTTTQNKPVTGFCASGKLYLS